MSDAKISVIIPSYNHEKYIGQAIDSVLAQTFTDFELLIADDCSKDNSREIIKKYKDERIVTYYPEKNLGAVPILDFLISKSKCNYIALLNSDDYWLPEKLEMQYDIMEKDITLGACFTWADMIDEKGRVLTKNDVPYADIFKQRNKKQGDWLRYFFFNSNCICHPSMLIRKEVYSKLGSYKRYLCLIPDYEMWIRLIKNYPIYMIEKNLVVHRRHLADGSNTSAESFDNAIRGRNELYLVYDKFFDGIDDKVFKEGFSNDFLYMNANSHEEMLCEQAFLLLKNPLCNNVMSAIGLTKLAELLQKEDTRGVLSKTYCFTHSDYFALTTKYGIGCLDIKSSTSVKQVDKVIAFFENNKKVYILLKKIYTLCRKFKLIRR
jgi:glycosyltransferase involved in cell wall biosynthesis